MEPERDLMVPWKMLLLPMNSATNLVRGSSWISLEVPVCWMMASLMTMTLSAMDMASCCEWVTMMKVMPVSR